MEVISTNKLYTGNINNINLDIQRPEIKAWTELISLKWIPTNIEEMERLKEHEELHKLENQKGKRKRPQAKTDQQKPFNPEETQQALIPESQKNIAMSKRQSVNGSGLKT